MDADAPMTAVRVVPATAARWPALGRVLLLEAAVDRAARHGGSVLDGHPVDIPAAAGGTASPSALFAGTLPMFQRAGFAEIGRTYRTRPVMRRTLRRGRPARSSS